MDLRRFYSRHGELESTWEDAYSYDPTQFSEIWARMDAVGAFRTGFTASPFGLTEGTPGLNTIHISPQADTAEGVALGEIYDADEYTDRLVNLSTRAWVGTGNEILICGFVVGGDAPLSLLIRGVGPGLVPFGVPDTLTDPVLQLIDATGSVISINDNWKDSTNMAALAQASAAHTFPLEEQSSDAALLITLEPGHYTALLQGKNGGTGIGLVELYEVPAPLSP